MPRNNHKALFSGVDIKMLAIDLDGTLLTDDYELTSSNIEAINIAQQQGVYVTLATGRPPFAVLPYYQQLNLDNAIITYNGALVINANTGDALLSRPLGEGDTRKVIDIVKKNHLHPSSYSWMEWYVDERSPETDWQMNAMQNSPKFVRDLALDGPDRPHKIMVFSLDRDDRLSKGYQQIRAALPHLRLHYSGPPYIEVNYPGASKASALAFLTGWLGLLPENVMAIGNGVNDIEMLGFAEIGVVVGNSSSDIQAVADLIVAPNYKNGVAEAVHLWMANK